MFNVFVPAKVIADAICQMDFRTDITIDNKRSLPGYY